MPALGDVIARRYRLERELGVGGMGTVFEATQLSLARKVALKVIRSDRASEDTAKRFENETALIARLQHPHIVHVIDGGRDDDGTLFLAMELLSGVTLRKRMSEGVLAVRDALTFTEDIASALVATHAAGVLHRDLKAENVMLVRPAGQSERAKVLDFGIARIVGGAGGEKDGTPAGSVAGTPGYIAPEQMLGEEVDGRADLYALGVVLFEMLTGQPAFVGNSAVELMMQHLTVPAPRTAAVARARGFEVPSVVDELVAALLAKKPGQRPASAELLVTLVREMVATSAPTSPGTPTPLSAFGSNESTISSVRVARKRPILGRQLELAELEAGLDAMRAGSGLGGGAGTGAAGGLFFLVGEPGIGKTRLCDAFAEACARRDVDVVWGRAWEAGGAPAFYPWSEALDAVVAAQKDPPPPEDTAWLAEIVPSLRGIVAAPPALAPAEARFKVFAAVQALLKRASDRRPLAIVLDDLHAADAASLQLLLAVARELRRRRILIVGTYRDVEARLVEEVSVLLGQLAREARTIHLARLAPADVTALVASHAGKTVDDAVARAIFRTTQGNPLFIDELVRLLAAEDRLDAPGDGPLPVPLGVREAIRQRLGRLAAPTRAAAECAAIVGMEPDVKAIAAMLGARVDDALKDAQKHGIVARPDRETVRFTHALYREELLADLPDERRRALHVAAAAHLRTRADPPVVEIAVHLLEATIGADDHLGGAAAPGEGALADAVRAALVAGERLIATFAFEDAGALLQRALDALPAAAPLRGEVTAALGSAVLLAGDRPRAQKLLMQAAEIARTRGDAALLARAALGYGAIVTPGFVDAAMVALLDEARARLAGSDSPLLPRVTARLASAMQPSPRPHEAIALARDAFALARGHAARGDRATLLATLHDGMGALMSFVPGAERTPLNTELLTLAEQLGDPMKAQRARLRLCFDAVESGDLAALVARTESYAAAAEALGDAEGKWRSPLLRAMHAELRGERARAFALVDEAASAGPSSAVVALHQQMMWRIWEDPTKLAEAVAHASAFHSDGLRALLIEAAAAGRAHDRARAHAVLARIKADAMLWQAPGAMLFTGELALIANDHDVLARLCEAMLVYKSTWSSAGAMATYAEDAVSSILARMYAALGDHARAVEAGEYALGRVMQEGARGVLARTLASLAEALRARRAGDDVDRARALVEQARTVAGELEQRGLMPWLDELARI